MAEYWPVFFFEADTGGRQIGGIHQSHRPRLPEIVGEQRCELPQHGLHAARGEVAARHLGVLGGDAHMAPASRVVVARHLDRLGHGQAALADAEIDRRVDLGIVELHQHIGAADADAGRYALNGARLRLGQPFHVASGAKVGAFVALGFVAANIALNYAFEVRGVTLWTINSGYVLVGLTLAGAIIGGWRKKS